MFITQYGLGKPYKENKISQKIVRNCTQESFTRCLSQDTVDNRLIYFKRALQLSPKQDTEKQRAQWC